MAKEKQKKQGIASKDPLYRIIMAILALCVPIAGYFSNYFYYLVNSSVFKLLAQLKGDTADTGDTYDFVSLREIVQLLAPNFGKESTDLSGLLDSVAELKPALISFAVFFVLAIVLALVIFFFSCFSKKKLAPLCISVGGVLAMIGIRVSFHYISAPILDGTVSLSNFFENPIITAVLPFIAQVAELRLTTGYFLMLFLFIAMALWAGANMIIALGDKPQKEQKVK